MTSPKSFAKRRSPHSACRLGRARSVSELLKQRLLGLLLRTSGDPCKSQYRLHNSTTTAQPHRGICEDSSSSEEAGLGLWMLWLIVQRSSTPILKHCQPCHRCQKTISSIRRMRGA